ncbi:MAG: hypothetical protein D6705_18205 [Deltaproteobacteria bacterium]|nr:MAG: hypothetical protein D6705_18205 [Deltaproteobacteria bacterium]
MTAPRPPTSVPPAQRVGTPGGGTPAEAPAPSGASFWRILTGWILVPLVVASAIFGTGVHCGATRPDGWYTQAALWAYAKIFD